MIGRGDRMGRFTPLCETLTLLRIRTRSWSVYPTTCRTLSITLSQISLA